MAVKVLNYSNKIPKGAKKEKCPKKIKNAKKKNKKYRFASLAPNGSKWLQKNPNGLKWLQMASNNPKWLELLEMATKKKKSI